MRAGGLNKWYAQYVLIANIDAVDLTERRQSLSGAGQISSLRRKVIGQ
jgi:hypothetical protein